MPLRLRSYFRGAVLLCGSFIYFSFCNSDVGGLSRHCPLESNSRAASRTSRPSSVSAIDNAELGNLTGLLAKNKPAVAATEYTSERTSKNYAFVDAVARKNVELTMADIRKDSPVLAAMESNGAIKIAGAMYNVENRCGRFFCHVILDVY
jgi:hypothetical protein